MEVLASLDTPKNTATDEYLDLLLDTHTFLWFAAGSERMPVRIRRTIAESISRKRISIASFWEIGIKIAIGQLPEAASILATEAACTAQGIEIAPISVPAIHIISQMPFPVRDGRTHKDPFDRIIAATALVSGLTLLSADTIFDAYGVPRLWD